MKLGKSQRDKDIAGVASIAVCRGDRVLWLQREDNGKWTMPGGHLEPGEEPIDGAVRELWEETGFETKPSQLEFLGSKPVPGKGLEVFSFKVTIDDGEPSNKNDPDGEAQDFYWFLPEELDSVEHQVPREKNVTLGFLEEPEELSKGIKFWRSKDGLKIPHWTDPSRNEWDKGFHERLVQYMAAGDPDRLKPTEIPVTENNMGHFVQGAVGAGGRNRVPLYERMLAGGDRLPPIVVRRNGLGWHVVDGNARMQAALNRGIKKLDALELVDPVKKSEVLVDTAKVWPGRNYKLEWEYAPEELEKGLGTAIVLAGALAVGGARTPVHSHMQVKAAGKTPWNPAGLHQDLIPIAHLESSFGINMNHQKHSAGEFHTALGAVGLKPSTGHEEYLRTPDLQKKYPGLNDPADFLSRMRADHRFYNEVASAHWHRLRTLHQTPEKAAFAWRYGHGAARAASDAQVLKDLYVQKYKAMMLGTGLRKDETTDPPPEETWPVWSPERLETGVQRIKDGQYGEVSYVLHTSDRLPIAIQEAMLEYPDVYQVARFANRKDLHPDIYRKLAERPEVSIRRQISANPNAPVDVLKKLYLDGDSVVASNVVANRKVPPEIVDAALKHSDEDVRSTAASRSTLTPEQVHAAVRSPYPDVVHTAIQYQTNKITPEDFDYCVKHPEWNVRRAAAGSGTSLNQEQFDLLVGDKDTSVQAATIRNHAKGTDGPHFLTSDQISGLLNNRNFWLEQDSSIAALFRNAKNFGPEHHGAFVNNPEISAYERKRLFMYDRSLPKETIDIGIASEEPDIRVNAIKHKDATVDQLRRVVEAPSPDLHNIGAVFDTNTDRTFKIPLDMVKTMFKMPPDVNRWATRSVLGDESGMFEIDRECVDLAMQHPKSSVRQAALSHPLAAEEHIAEGLRDEDEDVRLAAVSHRLVTPQQLRTALQDGYESVRVAALRNPKISPDDLRMVWRSSTKERNWTQMEEIARNKKCPSDILRRGLVMKGPDVKEDLYSRSRGPNYYDRQGAQNLQAAVLQNPNLSTSDLEFAFKLPDLDSRYLIMQHPNVSEKLIMEGKDHEDETVRDAANEIIKVWYPDAYFGQSVNVKLGVAKLRLARDHIESKGVKELKPKEMPPGDWAIGRLPNGNIGADKIHAHIESLPGTRYNISHAVWRGAQRHNAENSQVLQVNLTNAHVQAMKEAGVYGTFRDMHEASLQSGHPVNQSVGIGWIRYTGDPNSGIFVDEVQTDLGQSFVRQAAAQAAQQGLDVEEATRRAQKRWPEEHYKKISEILFGGKHPNEMLTEAFHQWLRDWGNHSTQVHIHTVESKAPISLGKELGKLCVKCGKSRKEHTPNEHSHVPGEVSHNLYPAVLDAPVHFNQTYKEIPKKMGKEPRKYGDLPTQDNKEMQGQPTWGGPVRKAEQFPAAHVVGHMMDTDGSGDPEWQSYLEGRILQHPHWTLARLPIRAFDSGDSRNPDTIDEYAGLSPDTMPPIIAVPGSSQHEVLDGGHRLQAAEARGDTHVMAYVPTGVRKAETIEVEDLAKSIQDLKPGEEIANLSGYERYDYTHLIRSPVIRKKYRLFADHVKGWSDSIRVRLTRNGSEEVVGMIDAAVDHKNKAVDPVFIEIKEKNERRPEHRGKGLGQAMYEALYSHAYHKLGVKRVTGGSHSTQAHRVHRILAERHGWDYAPAYEPHEWNNPRPFDNSAGDYDYLLKSEFGLEPAFQHRVTGNTYVTYGIHNWDDLRSRVDMDEDWMNPDEWIEGFVDTKHPEQPFYDRKQAARLVMPTATHRTAAAAHRIDTEELESQDYFHAPKGVLKSNPT